MNAVFGTSGYKYGEEMRPKKKKKNVFLEESNNFRGRGWQVRRLGRGNSSKKKKAVCRFASRFRGGPVGLQMLKLYYDSNRR